MQDTRKNTDGKPATTTIQLDGVAHKDNKLLAFFLSGKHRWEIECKATDLQSFARFQAKIADKIGLWADHNSQYERRARNRSEEWNDSVASAFNRGRPE